ncbi:MAG: hypothetical protein ABGZ17_07875 [Planctomycetaceae bacterium]
MTFAPKTVALQRAIPTAADIAAEKNLQAVIMVILGFDVVNDGHSDHTSQSAFRDANTADRLVTVFRDSL